MVQKFWISFQCKVWISLLFWDFHCFISSKRRTRMWANKSIAMFLPISKYSQIPHRQIWTFIHLNVCKCFCLYIFSSLSYDFSERDVLHRNSNHVSNLWFIFYSVILSPLLFYFPLWPFAVHLHHTKTSWGLKEPQMQCSSWSSSSMTESAL